MATKRLPKPLITRDEAEAFFNRAGVSFEKGAILGLRGYYANSMGKPGVNDRGIYDDVFVVLTPEVFAVFNGNTDPSIYRKGIGTLQPGIYKCFKFNHKRRIWGLQIVHDVLVRDGSGNTLFEGRHGINFHDDRDGLISKDSLACQTLPKSIYPKFKKVVYAIFDKYSLEKVEVYDDVFAEVIPYLLVDITKIDEQTIPTKSSKPAPIKTSELPKSLRIKFGDSGNEVAKIQQKLFELEFLASSDIDGKFGKKTKTAVEAFQRKHDLVADGIVGPKTRALLLK